MKLPEKVVLYGCYLVGVMMALGLGGWDAAVAFAAGAAVAYAIHTYEARK